MWHWSACGCDSFFARMAFRLEIMKYLSSWIMAVVFHTWFLLLSKGLNIFYFLFKISFLDKERTLNTYQWWGVRPLLLNVATHTPKSPAWFQSHSSVPEYIWIYVRPLKKWVYSEHKQKLLELILSSRAVKSCPALCLFSHLPVLRTEGTNLTNPAGLRTNGFSCL